MGVLISCETGGQRAPSPLAWHSQDEPPGTAVLPEIPPLASDPHARFAAQRLADGLEAELLVNEFSPELIDVSRSTHHRELFPKLTRHWSDADKTRLVDSIYVPYRRRVRRAIAGMMLRSGYVIHLAVRTFALHPKGHGIAKPRRADVGLLYDPSIDDEVEFCLDWIDELYDEAEMLRVRRNYPRRGTHDCITKSMRTEFAGMRYLGIEVMLNRAWVGRDVRLRDEAMDGLVWSLRTITDEVATGTDDAGLIEAGPIDTNVDQAGAA